MSWLEKPIPVPNGFEFFLNFHLRGDVGPSANEVFFDVCNGVFGQILVNFSKNSAFHVWVKSMTRIRKRTGWSNYDKCLYISGANDLLHNRSRMSREIMLLELMPISHLHTAALVRSRTFESSPRVIGPLLVRGRIVLGEDTFGLQIDKLFISGVAQK